MSGTNLLFAVFIFASVWWVSINVTKLIRGQAIPFWNFVIMSAAITGVIAHAIGLW